MNKAKVCITDGAANTCSNIEGVHRVNWHFLSTLPDKIPKLGRTLYMSKILEIQEELLRINDAVFQNLCDAYIYLTEPEYPGIIRSGSQKGKQKTVKGTPDSYYILPNGKYVLLEYTTKEKRNLTAFKKKITEDLTACMNPTLTGIPLKQVEKIIYCCNVTLNSKEMAGYQQLCKKHSIRLEMKPLDILAEDILTRCPHIALQYMGIAIDTGQVLQPTEFVREYESTGYATPLSIPFVSRVNELQELVTSIETGKVSILRGAPGVGKTKLVLEAFQQLRTKSNHWKAYCITNKHTHIYDDLRTYLRPGGHYLIFMDDANRQIGHLKTLLPLLKETRKGSIHIAITVRDYVFNTVSALCEEFAPHVVTLSKMTDEQITTLVAAEPYNIHHLKYVNRILEISDGNPRLAIMAAIVAKKKGGYKNLVDVSVIYDRYFADSLGKEFMDKPYVIKTLGILSFFNAIDKTDQAFCETLYGNFSITADQFREALTTLEDLELVSLSTDRTIVKLVEQILGTYFFYKTFFKEKVLSFDTILTSYFDTHLYRITETIIPANNTFGYDNVLQLIDPFLIGYWRQIASDTDKAFKFLDLFWYYKQEEALAFVYEELNQHPQLAVPDYSYHLEKMAFGREKDRYLELLAKFFHYPMDALPDAIELAFEYVERKPATFSYLVDLMKTQFLFTWEDELDNFYRQTQFITMLTGKHGNLVLKNAVFYHVVSELMKFRFQTTSGGRQRNSYSINNYRISGSAPILKLRKIIWKHLSAHFKGNEHASEKVIENYVLQTPEKDKAIFSHDLELLVPFIKKHFRSGSFNHCYIVQNLVSLSGRLIGKEKHQVALLKETFRNSTYEIFLKISLDKLRDKEEDAYDYTMDEYQDHKLNEIKKHFYFNNLPEFKRFYQTFLSLSEWANPRNQNFSFSLDVILEEAMKSSSALGLSFVQHIIAGGNPSGFTLYRIWGHFIEQDNHTDLQSLYQMIASTPFNRREDWLFHFYAVLPENWVLKSYASDLVRLFNETSLKLHPELSWVHKFAVVRPNIYSALLKVIMAKNAQETGIQFHFRNLNFIIKNSAALAANLPLVKKCYLQQQKSSAQFDYGYKNFVKILELDGTFLIEYLKSFGSDWLNYREHLGLHIIWQLDNAPVLMRDLFNYMFDRKRMYFQEDFVKALFDSHDTNVDRILAFFKSYLSEYKNNADKCNIVFDCIRSVYGAQLEEILQWFLVIQPDFTVFKGISWNKRTMISNGKTPWGDIRAREYQLILDILEKIKKSAFKYAKHKTFLKERIIQERVSADRDRRYNFMRNE